MVVTNKCLNSERTNAALSNEEIDISISQQREDDGQNAENR